MREAVSTASWEACSHRNLCALRPKPNPIVISDEFTGVANLQAELTNPSVARLALTMQGCGYVVARNTAETTKADRIFKILILIIRCL